MVSAMLFSDLNELKSQLDIDPANTTADKNLGFLLENVSQWIEEFLCRPGMSRAARTEYYGGNGRQRLPLRSRPVYTSPTILVYEDESGYFGSPTSSFDAATTALTYGTDFALDIDSEDGSSRSGLLIRINDTWAKPQVRERGFLSSFVGQAYGTLKITYTAGYTVDNLPASIRLACNILIAKIRHLLPFGFFLTSESYEDRSVGYLLPHKRTLMADVEPMLLPFKNWHW